MQQSRTATRDPKGCCVFDKTEKIIKTRRLESYLDDALVFETEPGFPVDDRVRLVFDSGTNSLRTILQTYLSRYQRHHLP